MELVKSNLLTNSSVVLKEDNVRDNSTIRSKKKILSEEEYTEKMEKIITRDFFPDLPKLKAQNAYLGAVEKGDIAKIQEIQLTYQPTQSTRSRISSFRDTTATATFDTPDLAQSESPFRTNSEMDDTASVLSVSEKKNESLDEFLAQTTSEDNASFQVIMEKSAVVHQQKYPWLYKDEIAEQKKVSDLLTLPAPEDDSTLFKKPELVTWAYKNRNALMYVPDGAEFTVEERLAYENRKKISHINTRFETPPFDEEANKEAIAEAASIQAKMKEGKVGIDGKEIIPSDSPQVNNYGFVGTPVPEPGVTDTPIMTWGEIEGTPFRLDGSDTPLPQHPSVQQFKIPNLSARERIALSLADNVAKKHRKFNITNTDLKSPLQLGLGSMTPLERLQSMSPAARKLACSKLGIQRDTDKALRASYSPSPLRTPNSCRTPQTPSTPVITPVHKTAVITLNDAETLMSLPKRHKASDYF